MVNICLSRFLSEYKITEFYDKISSNVGAKYMMSGTIITQFFQPIFQIENHSQTHMPGLRFEGVVSTS